MVATILTGAAESNRAVLRYIPEASWGIIPAAGVVKSMRITSSGLTGKKATKLSEEIRADRMVSNIIEVAATTDGDIAWELSAGGQDDFWEQFMLANWSRSMNFLLVKGESVRVTGVSQITLMGKDWTDWLAVDQHVKLEGYLNLTNNGYFKVTAAAFTAGNTVITVAETGLAAELGSSFTKLSDANDVLLKSTTTAITAGNTINGGGANAFAGLGLKPGQKLFMEGLGKETATLAVAGTAVNNNTFKISDGVTELTFEFATSAALIAPGHVFVIIDADPSVQAELIIAAVNDQFRRQNFRVSGTQTGGTITLTNHLRSGGLITETGANLTGSAFAGGSTSKGGFVTIAALPDDDTIVTSEPLTADANAGGATVVIKGSHLRNPGDPNAIIKKSISAETGFTDVGKYLTHSGLRLDSFKMALHPGDIVKGSFAFKGRETLPMEATVLGGAAYTLLDTTSTEVLNATSNVGNVLRNGEALQTAILKIDINGDAALREQKAVGAKFPAGIGYGRLVLKGTLSAYFQNFDLYRDFYLHRTASLAWDFEDADHNRQFYTIPSVKLLSDPISPDGIDKDVTEDIQWTAQRDASLETMFMIDRFSSVWPTTVA